MLPRVIWPWPFSPLNQYTRSSLPGSKMRTPRVITVPTKMLCHGRLSQIIIVLRFNTTATECRTVIPSPRPLLRKKHQNNYGRAENKKNTSAAIHPQQTFQLRGNRILPPTVSAHKHVARTLFPAASVRPN